MAITKMAMLVAVVVGLLAMVQQSVQMSDDTSCMLRETRNDLSSWAIVFSERTIEKTILDSGDFVLTGTEVIAGRVFRTGTLIGRSIVLVNTGKYSANVASALQIALSCYRIRGVLYLGLAEQLVYDRVHHPGFVIIPKCVAFSAIWDWLSLDANPEGQLVFGNFNQGENQQNALGSVKFNNVTLCIDEQWMKKALDIKAQLSPIPIVVGLVGASSDMKINNKAYAVFLSERFRFRTMDQESATVALVSKSNDKRFIVFHGVSNIVTTGVPATEEGKQKAAKNAYLTLKAFLSSLPEEEAERRGYITTYV